MTPSRRYSQTPLPAPSPRGERVRAHRLKHTSVWILGAALVFLLNGGVAVAQHQQHAGDHASHGSAQHTSGGDTLCTDMGYEPSKEHLFNYDLSPYSKKVQKEIISEAFRIYCDCGCEAMPVAYCLVNDRSCLRASQMAEAIIKRVTGEPYIDVKLDRSINEGPIVGVDLDQLPKKQADELMARLPIMQCTCGCELGLLRCLSVDPLCKASPLILARTYREITGNEIPGVTPLRLSEANVKTYDALPGIDMSRLSDEQRALVIERANKHPCTCGCGHTLAECRHEDPECEYSLPSINGIIFRIITEIEE